jgi:hypothetical protein
MEQECLRSSLALDLVGFIERMSPSTTQDGFLRHYHTCRRPVGGLGLEVLNSSSSPCGTTSYSSPRLTPDTKTKKVLATSGDHSQEVENFRYQI